MKNRNLDNHDNWSTPKWLYDQLNQEFNFDYDPCPLNSDYDGLCTPWGKRNFINPPYSRKLKEAFIKKALYETKYHNALCVLLLPVSTSTNIFHDIILPNAEIRYIRGRVRFIGVNTFGEQANDNPMHDSMVIIFRPK